VIRYSTTIPDGDSSGSVGMLLPTGGFEVHF
jgi:hypothetical protein